MVAISVARRFLLGGHSRSELGRSWNLEMATKILPLTTSKLDMTRPGSLAYSLCLLLTVPKLCGGARRVKDDLVVLPQALEEIQGSALVVAVLDCKPQNFGERSVPIYGAEQPVLESINGENEIGERVRPVNQHRYATWRQTFPDAHRPRQCNGNVVAPTIASEGDRLTVTGAIVAVRAETVRDHCSAEEFDSGVLQPGG